jgi:signal transduction histidine kinase
MAEGVALLAHDLRNPLAAVRSAVDLVRRTPDPDLLRSTACRMERQLAHLGRLIEDLLESARLDRGKARLSLRRLAVDSLVNDAISLATPYTAPARQQVVVALDNDLGSIDADADKIIQVLGNLLHNASKFSPAGSTITVRGASTGADVVIAVRDAGIGIEPQYLERIFSRYAQVESGAHNGLGLGLSLARQWMELHGGKIVARSSGPGAGAEFVLTFRRTPPAHPDEVGASPRPIAPLQVRQPSGHTPEWMRRPLPLSPFPFIRTRQALPHVPTSGQASASTTNEAGV